MASSNMVNKRAEGERYEAFAARFLEEQGHEIIEKNFRCKVGEIDLITKDEGYLVFVEVKYRATGANGSPSEAVGFRKMKTICMVSDFYRFSRKIGDVSVRYDVVSIEGDELTYIKNAFDYIR